MSQQRPRGLLAALRQWLARLLGDSPHPPINDPAEAAQPTRLRVLLIVYNPSMEAPGGRKLSDFMGWRDPGELVNAFISDIHETSGGLAEYHIVERIDVDAFPVKADGYRYTPQTYLSVMRRATAPHTPERVDYHEILRRFNVLARVAANQVDEVWVFAFPHAGFYESILCGAGAFWCNAPPLAGTESCHKRFVVMGFSYERGVGEMLEAFGHRAESLLQKTFSRTSGAANLYEKFIRYDKVAPGRAEVGTIHYAPNSDFDYDWGNARPVPSACDDWLNFPNFTGATKMVDAHAWGGGEIRAHHRWWLQRLPRANGRQTGIANNWWQYVMDANRVQP